MTKLCENSRSCNGPMARYDVKLQLIEVEELDVWGSLVLSDLDLAAPDVSTYY